jgi:putative N6-adenine-specific DNA methylase
MFRLCVPCLLGMERVLLEMKRFEATSFEELFEGTAAIPWENFLDPHAAFPVKGYSLNSELFSVSSCQKIIKKAVAQRLSKRYGLSWLPEDGAKYQIQFAIMNNQISLCFDTTGEGLHKRGYRPAHGAAPLKETLAAAIVELSRYRGREEIWDPFCGSGTIPIEAALIARNIAPGLNRSFAAMKWPMLPPEIWEQCRQEARDLEFRGHYSIRGSDIDPAAVAMARENASRAGVADCIQFAVGNALDEWPETKQGKILTNPPYGERLLDASQAEKIYKGFGGQFMESRNWQVYLLSAYPEFERAFGCKADRKRKLYNGMVRCDLFMYTDAENKKPYAARQIREAGIRRERSSGRPSQNRRKGSRRENS